jgi:hypothetical protein
VRRLIVAFACAACGGRAADRKAPSYDPMYDPAAQPVPVTVEWKVEQGDGNLVNVSLVVDGNSIAVGALEAATQDEPGTPATCALRAASSKRTELVCGEGNAFSAELVVPNDEGQAPGLELIISRVSDQPTRIKTVPVQGDFLAVKMLVLPGSKL